MTVPLACCVYVGTTMECQYSAACHALSGRLAAVNRRSGSWAAARSLAAAAEAHGRLARLARLFNGEYGAPIFLTTVNLLLNQIYAMNDVVSVFVAGETFEPAYVEFTYAHNAIVWTVSWLRLWWICYRVDGLTGQVHLTAKIMLEKDINAYPGNTRQLAFDFLDQLLHRHIRITAWGFYDVNKELLFMVLGYQCGLCLICTQFTTSGIQLINSLTTIQKNYTSQSSQ
ncbi:7TM chemoreceptor [Cinara cedri]|uniref:7TM chemoreceptor n=1 Tax=Cinara cedri TaxID=506608 RepID=A0A5E4NIY7_9HEMI|nr:7TM chemoreceptor [Cinara cedri]